MVKAKEGMKRGNYVDAAEPEGKVFRYRASFREFIVPEGFEQMEVLKNAYYILSMEEEELTERKNKEYYQNGSLLGKIKYRIKNVR